MALFPLLDLEPTVQVGDKTRLDASKSFVTADQDSLSSILIDPTGSAGFIDVTETQYLDWAYAASGTFNVKLKILAGAASASAMIQHSISIVTEAQDKLFSNDADLRLHEFDILKWVPDGRATFKDMHRRAQIIIIQWLSKEGYVRVNDIPFTKTDIIDIEEVKQWSTYITLRLIFEGLSNATDDIFHVKSTRYFEMEQNWRDRAILRIDVDGDGIVNPGEGVDPRSGFIARR